MDVTQVLIEVAVMWALVWAVMRFVIRPFLEYRFRTQMGDALEVLRELEAETLIPLQVEQHGDQYFCYNSITKDFVCQGRDLQEIQQRFAQRFPDKSAALHQGDEAVMTVLRQQLKEQREDIHSIRSTS